MSGLNNLIITAIAVMLLLAFGIIFFVVMYQRRMIYHQQEIRRINDQKQLELIQASIQGEEEERMRIATELHDDVGATLSSVRLFLHAAAQKDADPIIIHQSRDLLDDSIQKIRNISHRLQPALLSQLGLQASLESFTTMISRPGMVKMLYVSSSPLPRFDENIELSVYRMVQELSSNIIRHAAATTITLNATLSPGQLRITLIHDGAGLTQDTYHEHIYKKGSIGLKNIVNRLKTIDASIGFGELNDGRFIINIITPLIVKSED